MLRWKGAGISLNINKHFQSHIFMNLLGFLSDSDFVSTSTPNVEEYKTWSSRIAVRAVLLNAENSVCIMHSRKYDFYALPGGGIDSDETLEIGFAREIEEESGFIPQKVADLGVFIEKRDFENVLQVSFCYLARATKPGQINMTEGEQSLDFEILWVNMEDAIKLVAGNKREHYDMKFNTPRLLSMLEKAKEMM